MKKCKKCFELKKDSEFPTLLECHKKVGQKIIHQCKQCVSDKSKKWYSKNKDRHKARTQKWNKNNEQERKN
ncbi:MAG TPA: hypothetical protein PKV66_06125, partial [Candidatus Pelethenecus sp.]|nr:hypothetical protein [Candidatus Pelethenecus sp.]